MIIFSFGDAMFVQAVNKMFRQNKCLIVIFCCKEVYEPKKQIKIKANKL